MTRRGGRGTAPLSAATSTHASTDAAYATSAAYAGFR
tara:strand:+ start:257 stop:367 length:111 start_codon:yes stop_codon:yes gene_type:complete